MGEEVKVSKAMIREISKVASDVAIAEFQNMKSNDIKNTKDKRLHNTKLLIKKYRWLEEFNNNAIYDTAQLCQEGTDDILELMGVDVGDRHQVGSIRNNVIVARIIMEHIETMLGTYKRKCIESKKPEIKRRWRVLYYMYISKEPMTAQEIADKECISVSMVYADVDSAVEALSSLFFGIDLSEFVE